MKPCIYQRTLKTREHTPDGKTVHECLIYRRCTNEKSSQPEIPACTSCSTKLELTDTNLERRFQDNLLILDRFGKPTQSIRNMVGPTAFLVCGGPSTKSLNLSLMNQRGIWSLAVNNMAGSFWPNAFICADPPQKFHNGIWLDPTIMKFVPTPKMRGGRSNLREKVGDEFLKIKSQVSDCPNIWGFERRSWLRPDESFFTEPSAAWGNHDAGVFQTGQPKTVCTMLLAIRVLYHLGARRIYLVGADFTMDPSANLRGNYAFGEARDEDAIKSNNQQYQVVNQWLVEFVKNGTFKKFGLELFNTNPYSHLRAFAHVPFEFAIRDALTGFPQQPFDLTDWYKKDKKKETKT